MPAPRPRRRLPRNQHSTPVRAETSAEHARPPFVKTHEQQQNTSCLGAAAPAHVKSTSGAECAAAVYARSREASTLKAGSTRIERDASSAHSSEDVMAPDAARVATMRASSSGSAGTHVWEADETLSTPEASEETVWVGGEGAPGGYEGPSGQRDGSIYEDDTGGYGDDARDYEVENGYVDVGENSSGEDVTAAAAATDAHENDYVANGVRILGGKYHVERMVGEGAYGKVMRCRAEGVSGQEVAVKEFKISDSDADAEDVKRTAHREAALMRQLAHAHVVRCLDSFLVRDRLFLVMEFLPMTLLDLLEASNGGRGLERSVIRRLVYQLVKVMRFIHSQVRLLSLLVALALVLRSA